MNSKDASVAIFITICITLLSIVLIIADSENKQTCYKHADNVIECK